MAITEVKGDLFLMEGEDFKYVHCISADFSLSQGIAKTFDRKFGVRNELIKTYGGKLGFYTIVPDCLLTGKVFNLVTKKFKYNKPTYDTIEMSLIKLREQCKELGVKKLVMPKIGCGLDKMDWKSVKKKIHKTFRSTDIEIIVFDKED